MRIVLSDIENIYLQGTLDISNKSEERGGVTSESTKHSENIPNLPWPTRLRSSNSKIVNIRNS